MSAGTGQEHSSCSATGSCLTGRTAGVERCFIVAIHLIFTELGKPVFQCNL
ncbi:hypothetical protein H3U94_04365 [Bartonella sp. W8125]|uniref:hypothetical protein n=1 Tax=Bartonella TaxID=773 RepID=UPI0018DDA59E|nr:hypothetical protein [Bartonella choladocola]MBI0140112.1 hypothetical protein [Bartonella choladocola]